METVQPQSFTPIAKHPLPFSEELEDFLEAHPQFSPEDDVTVDELHSEWTTTLADNGRWKIFKVGL